MIEDSRNVPISARDTMHIQPWGLDKQVKNNKLRKILTFALNSDKPYPKIGDGSCRHYHCQVRMRDLNKCLPRDYEGLWIRYAMAKKLLKLAKDKHHF